MKMTMLSWRDCLDELSYKYKMLITVRIKKDYHYDGIIEGDRGVSLIGSREGKGGVSLNGF